MHDGLAAHPDYPDLLQLSKEIERQFVVHKTLDTAAVMDEMLEAKTRAGEKTKQAEHDIAIAVRNEKWSARALSDAKRAFDSVAPFCPQYEKINFFKRKCKYCHRKKAACEASRPAKEELDKWQAKHKKVSLSAEHFAYLFVGDFLLVILSIVVLPGDAIQAADVLERTRILHENPKLPLNVASEALEKAREVRLLPAPL